MRPALLLPSIAALAAVACINGEVTGGEALSVIANVSECSTTGDACFTWQYLYACYFGPTGVAGCSGQSNCHGSATSLGAETGYWVCGATSDACWQGMTTGMPGLPTLVRSGVAPTQTVLYSALHKSTGKVASAANNMPLASIDTQLPSYTFTPSDLACIEGWIKAGAKND